jgi:hypothetical protein
VALRTRAELVCGHGQIKEIDALVERLREFVRLNYMTAAEVARQIGVRDSAVYSWLQGEYRPEKPERITAFLDSLPRENGSGIAPMGYEYREYKNWCGVPKPRRWSVLIIEVACTTPSFSDPASRNRSSQGQSDSERRFLGMPGLHQLVEFCHKDLKIISGEMTGCVIKEDCLFAFGKVRIGGSVKKSVAETSFVVNLVWTGLRIVSAQFRIMWPLPPYT